MLSVTVLSTVSFTVPFLVPDARATDCTAEFALSKAVCTSVDKCALGIPPAGNVYFASAAALAAAASSIPF